MNSEFTPMSREQMKNMLVQHIMSQPPVRELNVQVYDDPRTGKIVKVEGIGFDLKEIGKVITQAEDFREDDYIEAPEPTYPPIQRTIKQSLPDACQHCRDCSCHEDDNYHPFYNSSQQDDDMDPQDLIIDSAFRPEFTPKNKVTLDAMIDLVQKFPEVANKLVNLAKLNK